MQMRWRNLRWLAGTVALAAALGACRRDGAGSRRHEELGEGAEPAAAAVGHVLVVGGTGMLRPVAMELARRGHVTSVIARGRDELDRMARESGGRVHPLALDYQQDEALATGLRSAISAHGPPTLVVAWIHGSAPRAPIAVARIAAEGGNRDRDRPTGAAPHHRCDASVVGATVAAREDPLDTPRADQA